MHYKSMGNVLVYALYLFSKDCSFLALHREGLGEAYDGDIGFASSLESFGGGFDDPIYTAVGGNYFVVSFKFISIFCIY